MGFLGIGKGKIDMDLEKYGFAPGETIRGKLKMELKKPIDARCLKIGLVAEEFVRERRMNGNGTHTTRRKVFDFDYPLDGEKTYAAGEHGPYEFEITVPDDEAADKDAGEHGITQTVAKVVRLANTVGQGRMLRWHLVAALDVPKAFDVKKRVKINVA